MHSTSTNSVLNSTYVNNERPKTFIEQRFVLQLNLSHIPPCQGANAVMNFHVTPFATICCFSLGKRINLFTSMLADLKVFALSDIMNDCHHKVLHNGTRETLNLTRQTYWVLRGREMARRIVKRFILCKRIEGLFF